MPHEQREIDPLSERPWTMEGAIVRGSTSSRQIALIFTGGDFGEDSGPILDELANRKINASFFLTGDFLRNKQLANHVMRILADGHYLGPHSDRHLLYCAWEDRSNTLVSEEQFKNDLRKNIDDLRKLGALTDQQSIYFIPPFEWYNQQQVNWSRDMGVRLFNFTPGSGSNRDWAPESHQSFVPSLKILDDILAYEQEDEHGLNGFLLLLHLGSERKDKMSRIFGRLLDELRRRGYSFVRIDEMLH